MHELLKKCIRGDIIVVDNIAMIFLSYNTDEEILEVQSFLTERSTAKLPLELIVDLVITNYQAIKVY